MLNRKVVSKRYTGFRYFVLLKRKNWTNFTIKKHKVTQIVEDINLFIYLKTT